MFRRVVGQATRPGPRGLNALVPAATLPAVSANPAFDLQSFLASLPTKPGVYRMLGKEGEILYVGKARHLKNRVSSYFHGRSHADRTQALLAQVAASRSPSPLRRPRRCCSSSISSSSTGRATTCC